MAAPIQRAAYATNTYTDQPLQTFSDLEKKLMQEHREALFQLKSWFSIKQVGEWKETTREAVFSNLDYLKTLKKVNPVAVVDVLERTSITFDQLKGVKDLFFFIQRPGPDPLISLLNEGIEWNTLSSLTPLECDKLLNFHRAIPVIKKLGITSEGLLNLPASKREWVLENHHSLSEWIEQKANLREILDTELTILKEFSVKPYRMTCLLEVSSWKSIANLEPTVRAKVLQNASKLTGMMQSDAMTLEEALQKIAF